MSVPGRADVLRQASWPLIISALAMLCLSVLAPQSPLSVGLLGSGTVLALAALTLAACGWQMRRSRRDLLAIAVQLCRREHAACFLTNHAGRTLQANAASRQRFRSMADPTLQDGLASCVAAPEATVAQLLAQARACGEGLHEVETRRFRHRISVVRIDDDLLLWRLDELNALAGAGGGLAGLPLSLPMLVAARDGQVQYVNPALSALLGAEPAHLSEVLTDLPLRPGKVHQLLAAAGPQRVRVAEYPGPSGRSEIYLFPDQTQHDASDWSLADDFPVPMLKLAASGTVLVANAQARALLGPGAPEGRELGDLVEGLGRSLAQWLSEAAGGTGLGRPEVVRVVRSDRELYLQIRLGRLDKAPRTELVAVLSDLTELKTLESKFVQSQKMQAIGQLAGGVAHDFNNLLTAISGHCDLLLMHCGPEDPAYADLQQIAQNANRAAALVSHLLAFSRKQNLQPEVLDLRPLLADHSHLLKRLMGEKVRLSYTVPDGLPPVRADRRQFEQVIMNLAMNARDAMPGGGEIRIALRREVLSAPLTIGRVSVPPGDWLVVSVEDEGPGIAEERRDKIFEPFYTTKRAGEGTGLGLSTAYGIVKQSGGYIFAREGARKGADMKVWLPALPAGSQPSLAPRPLGPKRGWRRPDALTGIILLVEDEEPVRAFASRALRLKGHTVIEAASGEQALAILVDEQLQIDVIVTDVVMPGLDGPTWTEQALRTRPQTAVVFISGYAEDAVAGHQTRISGSVFLQKPFTLEQLTETVCALLA